MENFQLIIDLKNSCVASCYNRREPFSLPTSLHLFNDATVTPASDDTKLAPQATAHTKRSSASERAHSTQRSCQWTPLNIDVARFAATPECTAARQYNNDAYTTLTLPSVVPMLDVIQLPYTNTGQHRGDAASSPQLVSTATLFPLHEQRISSSHNGQTRSCKTPMPTTVQRSLATPRARSDDRPLTARRGSEAANNSLSMNERSHFAPAQVGHSVTWVPPAIHSSGHQRSTPTAPSVVNKHVTLCTSDTPADLLTDNDCLSYDDATIAMHAF